MNAYQMAFAQQNGNGERSSYAHEKQKTMFGKLPVCLATTNLWQNPRMFDI